MTGFWEKTGLLVKKKETCLSLFVDTQTTFIEKNIFRLKVDFTLWRNKTKKS